MNVVKQLQGDLAEGPVDRSRLCSLPLSVEKVRVEKNEAEDTVQYIYCTTMYE